MKDLESKESEPKITAPEIGAAAAEPPARSRKKWLVVGALVLLVASIAGAAAFFLSPETRETVLNPGQQRFADDREYYKAELGIPDSFTIVYDYSQNASKPDRLETWFYKHTLTSVNFKNGEFLYYDLENNNVTTFEFSGVDPTIFGTSPSKADVDTLGGESIMARTPVFGEDLAAKLYDNKFMAGFKGDKVVIIQSLEVPK